MTNLIPLSGSGSRFEKEGYKLPKPLIEVSGVPMIIKVIRSLPKSNKWIFIVRRDHVENYRINEVIKEEIPEAIILIDPNPHGQATSCMVAEPYLDLDEELFIAPCDSSFLCDWKKFDDLKKRKDVDAIFFTLTKRDMLKANPNAWGWYKVSDNEFIKDISVKIPVSENPYIDHAVTATFYFKKAKYFVDSTKLMIKEEYRINNEFYVDALPRFLEKLNKKSVIFDVDLYVSWNKPVDLHDYERMDVITRKKLSPKDLNEEEKNLMPFWKKYFENE